ncbi:MAG: hypothetical protein KBS81_02395 [Spirochaetales bacterium]|nr:hypothetical protein [Candidatus Physcosoma equi]
MKKTICVLLLCFMALSLFAAFDAAYSDRLFYNEREYQKDYDYLLSALKTASSNEEKAEILWRLSRDQLTLTDENKDSMTEEQRLAGYGDYGANDKPKSSDTSSAYYYAYTSLSLKETPNAYHWEASAVGRAGQEHGALNSLGKASPMRKLETKALEEFSSFDLETDSWYVLSILYDALPGKPISFGDKNVAISYIRKCLMTQDSTNRTNGSNFLELAEQLAKRNWDAKKRTKEFGNMLKDYNKNASKGATEMNKYYEGYLASQGAPFYVSSDLASLSDKDEAVALLKYASSAIESRLKEASGEKAKETMEKELSKIQAKLKEWS